MRRAALMLTLAGLLAVVAPARAQTLPAQVKVQYGSIQEESPLVSEIATVFPSPTPDAPVVVAVHGGWWGKPRREVEMEKPMQSLQAHGVTVVDINYPITLPRLATEYGAVETAVRWAHEHAGEYNGDPADVQLLGSSAGGELVSMVADRMRAPAVTAVIELSAPGENMVTWVRRLDEGLGPDSGVTPTATVLECERKLVCSEDKEREVSATDHLPSAESCPAWLLAGSEADLVPLVQEEEMLAAARDAGCEAQLFVAAKGHAIAYWQKLKPTAIPFIKSH